jgi:3-hydroxyisobutyrate dehydrogenase
MGENQLQVGIVGGLGLMASPMAQHWHGQESVKMLRVHDRNSPGASRDKARQGWRDYGAKLVDSYKELVGKGDLDGIFVCAGKNGDDLVIIAKLAELLATVSPGAFICHMSTVSANFVRAAREFCTRKNIQYINYPLTGGPKGAENASMLILASGDKALYEKLEPSLTSIGKPKYFGDSITAGAEVKLIGHLMVFNGLIGICSAAATHTECLNDGQLGGEKQTSFFDFLNNGSGGTKQWDFNLRAGINENIWDKGFYMRHAVVDAIYLVQLLIDNGISWLAIESALNTALAFSYVINHVDPDLATLAIVREMINKKAPQLDKFFSEHSGPRNDSKACLAKCIQSLPENIRKTVALDIIAADFDNIFV